MNSGYEVFKIRMVHDSMINHSYLIVDNETRECSIIDPAWELDKIEFQISLIGGNLTSVFLTHCHYDHVNLVDELVEKYNTKVYMSKEEIDYYEFEAGNLVPIKDGEVIEIGKTPVECILTTGHTAGGICFMLKDCIFTGDTLFIEGCGICNCEGGSPEEMYDSIQKLKTLVGEEVRVFTGHSYGKEQGKKWKDLLQQNIYLGIDDKDTFVNFRMRHNQKNLFNFK